MKEASIGTMEEPDTQQQRDRRWRKVWYTVCHRNLNKKAGRRLWKAKQWADHRRWVGVQYQRLREFLIYPTKHTVIIIEEERDDLHRMIIYRGKALFNRVDTSNSSTRLSWEQGSDKPSRDLAARRGGGRLRRHHPQVGYQLPGQGVPDLP